jgi:hypothetical protein
MSKKLFGKKKKAPAPDAATGNIAQPVITALSALPANSPLKKRVARETAAATILGGGGLLGQ